MTTHMSALGSTLISGMYVVKTLENDKLDPEKRKTLAINDVLTWGISTACAYLLDAKLGSACDKATTRAIANHLLKDPELKRKDLFGVSHIGSRDDTTHYFVEDNRIICGCFDNTLEEFINKVKDTYDKNSKEYMEYMIAIDTFKRYKEMYYKIK